MKIDWKTNDKKYLNSYSSLKIFSHLLEDLGISRIKIDSRAGIDILSYFKTVCGLFALDKLDLDKVDSFTTNRYYQESLNLGTLPSSSLLKEGLGKVSREFFNLSNELYKNYLNLNEESSREIAEITPKTITDLYFSKSHTEDEYIKDFERANIVEDTVGQSLAAIHYLVINCLKFMAKKGMVGELYRENSLFTDEAKQSLEDNGYAIIPNVLDNEEVKYLRELILKLCEWEKQENAAFLYGGSDNCQRIYNLLNKHEIFRDLIQRPLILEIMEHLFNRDTLHDKYVLSSWHSNIIGEGGKDSILHVDSAVPEPLPEWIIRANINYMLDDFTKKNGATLCLPGSHKFLRKPRPADQDRKDLIQMTGKAGSLGIWNGHLWHKSGYNHTNDKRIALLGCFAASHLKEMSTEEEHLQIIDQENINGMTPTLKRLIGVGHGIKKGALQVPPSL